MLDCVRSTISGVPLVARAQRAHRRQRNQPARRAPKLAPTSSSIRNRTGSSTLCLGRGDGRRAILLSSILCLRPSVLPLTIGARPIMRPSADPDQQATERPNSKQIGQRDS